MRTEELLGRAPVCIDVDSISDYLRGKVVLVTGGGGSIGSELCRQIAAHEPARLIVLDIAENSVFVLQNELEAAYPALQLSVLIGSVRDEARMQSIFARYRPQVVYHAAAHKHVPLMEQNPGEAVKNNIFGTLNVAQAAHEYGAERFVLISTDKAASPICVMGACKRVCEMIAAHYNSISQTQFAAVRFGNVLGSAGSVLPTFLSQIEAGGPITITHPDATRYFMTVAEAVTLVLQAGALAQQGGIFMLDMGKPIRIRELAYRLIRQYGLEPERDVQVVYTGLRPGEKMTEQLYEQDEIRQPTANDRIFSLKTREVPTDLFSGLERLRMAAAGEQTAELRACLQDLVPSYRPGGASCITTTATGQELEAKE